MKLHCTKTVSGMTLPSASFCYHMKLHCTKTEPVEDWEIGLFCYHMKLHCTKTYFHLTYKKRCILLPYETTLY